MNDPQQARVARELALFELALARPPEERQAFLDSECGEDESMRAGIEALLAADSADDLTSTGGWQAGIASGNTLSAAALPRTFGGFEIVATLGRGGMGVVYLARQHSTGREVALKVIRPELVEEPQALRRFQREVEAASGLDHPGICTVYEAGAVDGVPYVAMRYVPGATLSELLAASDASTGGFDATTRQGLDAILRLFEKLAHALHAAHESGVLHRDVKPANVIVGSNGEPVLLDFGLARPEDLTGAERLTATAAQLGTPAYMAPEQIQTGSGSIDRRTDVYALGVTMYEFLARAHPFAAPTREQLYRRILAGRAPDLAKRSPRASGDLAVVVHTAMALEPDRRYETARDFAEDLERVRRRQSIVARPPSLPQRLVRWCRREPLVASLLAALLSIVGVAVRFAFAAEQARAEEQDQARAARQLAIAADEARRDQKRQAEQAREEAETARRISDFLVQLFRIADGSAYRGATITAREILDQGFARIQVRLDADPAIKARLMATMGEVYQYLSEYDRAQTLFERALTLRRTAGAGPRELAESLRNLGELHHHRDDYEAAESRYREALALLRTVAPGDDPDVATTLDLIGRVKGQTGALDESASLAEQVFAMRSRLPHDPVQLSNSHQSRAMLAIWRNDPHTAMREFAAAIELRRDALGDESGLLPELLHGLACTQQMTGDLEAARATALDSLQRTREIYGDHHHGVGRGLSLLGTFAADLGDPDAADRYYRESCEVMEIVYGENSKELATQLHNRGTLKLESGALDAAEDLLGRALDMRRAVLPEVHYDIGISLFALGALEAQRDEPAVAVARYRDAYSMLVEILPEDHPLPGMAAGRIADLLEAQDSPEAAVWRERSR